MVLCLNVKIILCLVLGSIGVNARSDELILLHAVWRHGDRSPTYVCKGDPNKEEIWSRYGGLGHLTMIGMKQHVALGNLVYSRYAIKEKFLSEKYQRDEIYVLSTDYGRTVLSAVSNMIGMYYKRGNLSKDDDYPGGDNWPPFYVPVPVYTTKNSIADILKPDTPCPRQSWLRTQYHQSDEWKFLESHSEGIINQMTDLCQEPISMAGNLWRIKDAFLLENAYNHTAPIDKETLNDVVQITNQVESMQSGMGMLPVNGIDFRTELGKIRAGGLLWDMIHRMDQKLKCLEGTYRKECVPAINLKYYAYSAHDTTLGSLLTALNAKGKILPEGGYPACSAALFIELRVTDFDTCLKFLYHRDANSGFEDVTEYIEGCRSAECCSYDEFRENSKKYYPSKNKAKLCKDTTSIATYFDPDHENDQKTDSESRPHEPLDHRDDTRTSNSQGSFWPAGQFRILAAILWTSLTLL